jgi:hypothetical protein
MARRPRGFYRRGGVTHPIMGKGIGKKSNAFRLGKPSKTLFGPARDKTLAKLVRGDTPEHARESVHDLERKFDESNTHREKLRIYHATDLEAKRLDILAHRKRRGGGYFVRSEAERRGLLTASKTFRNAAERMRQQIDRESG